MSGRHYVVTGVSRGIGAQLAALLAAAGHRVTGLDRIEPVGQLSRFIQLDLADPHSIARAAAAIDEPIDGLCNNAGIPPRDGESGMILRVNFYGQRRLTDALAGRLNTGASIVNIASRAGSGWRDNVEQVKRLATLDPEVDLPDFILREEIDQVRAYNLSKEALILWTFSEAETMAKRGLRINALCPGPVATDILQDFARAFGEKVARTIERGGRAGSPAEIAKLAAFMLSPDSSWLNGAEIPVDGGIGAFAVSDALFLDAMRSRRLEAAQR